MGIGEFLLIILAIWIIPKLIRGFLIINKAQKQARNFYEQMYNATGGAQQEERRQRGRKPGWTTPSQRRKKIDPEVGEYVKFQEVTVEETAQTTTDTSTGDTTTTYTVEQQVTDAEWEEIK